MLERSTQAKFLIPMAVSLAFGVIFSTAVSLLIVPSLYLMLEDAKQLPGVLRARLRSQPTTPSSKSVSISSA
jgi:hypothetical protein